MKIVLIIGTRPNFMKAYPIYNALKDNHEIYIIHTGQHFDDKMSKSILKQLGFPEPDKQFVLESKSRAGILDHQLYVDNRDYLSDKGQVIKDLRSIDGKMLGQLGEIRDKILSELENQRPDLVMVFGDVTSTLAGSLAASSLNIKIAHIESGLRSFDLSMPEEVNRILTDYLTSYFFVTEESGVKNLLSDNQKSIENIYLVGNTMIDSLYLFKEAIEKINYYEVLKVPAKSYILVTLHRPGNVDDLDKLNNIIDDLSDLSKRTNLTILFPIHPRTRAHLINLGILDRGNGPDLSNYTDQPNINIQYLDPLPYLHFISLVLNSKLVVTDSGGIQEETTALGIPCFTLRPNTERPSTLVENGGTNILIKDLVCVNVNDSGSVDISGSDSYLKDYKLISPIINDILLNLEKTFQK